MKFYSLGAATQGGAGSGRHSAGRKSGFLHIWGGAAGASSLFSSPLPPFPLPLSPPLLPSLSVSVKRRSRLRRSRQSRFTDTDKEGRVRGNGGRGPLGGWLRRWVDTHSLFECVSTWAGHRFGSECVSGGSPRKCQLQHGTCSYKPYFATACRMRAPHGTQMAARKPTVAAPCRQSHGTPAAYAATIAGQVMGST